jgi:glycosyltransferase involved in cell wall biosynthesis
VDHAVENARFGEWMVRRFPPPRVTLGFDTASRTVFRAWKGRSFLVLDLSIGLPSFRDRVYREARKDGEAGRGLELSSGEELSLYREETDLADLILCGSEFVRRTCLDAAIPAEKLRVIEYGVDLETFRIDPSIRKPAEPFRIAFVGNFAYRKGAVLLLRAFRRIREAHPGAELHVFGALQFPLAPHETEGVVVHGFVPQETLARDLQACHVLALPTFFEGSAISVYQAMALGLPVVTTPNSGSVVDASCGVVVPVGSEEALAQALLRLARDRDDVARMGANAAERARTYTWDRYGARLTDLIGGLEALRR